MADSTQQPSTPAIPNESGGVWTMTDAEFKRELADAWEAGMASAKLQAAGIKPARNPYRGQA